MATRSQSAGKIESQELAYIIGVYLGDGCTSKSSSGHCFRLSVIDKDFAEKTARYLSIILEKKVIVFEDKWPQTRGNKSNFVTQAHGTGFCTFLEDETNRKKVIPDFIKSGTVMQKKAFIEGIMDSEGFVSIHRDPKRKIPRYQMGLAMCDQFVEEIVEIMRSLGVKVSPMRTEIRYGCLPIHRYSINNKSWIESGMKFSIKRKEDRLAHYLELSKSSETTRLEQTI